MLFTGVLKNEHDVEELEENFEEAIKNVNNVLIKSQVCPLSLFLAWRIAFV